MFTDMFCLSYHSHNPVLVSSFKTYHRIGNLSSSLVFSVFVFLKQKIGVKIILTPFYLSSHSNTFLSMKQAIYLVSGTII
jgi:hypothetical protein